jgi:hypothetical protein
MNIVGPLAFSDQVLMSPDRADVFDRVVQKAPVGFGSRPKASSLRVNRLGISTSRPMTPGSIVIGSTDTFSMPELRLRLLRDPDSSAQSS